MHETDDIEFKLWDEAESLSQKYKGAPVVIIIGGDGKGELNRTMLGSSLHGNRFRDLLGILESAKQITGLKHFRVGDFGKRMEETAIRREERITQGKR